MSNDRWEEEIAKKIKRDQSYISEIMMHGQIGEANGGGGMSPMGRRHMLGPPGSLNTITPCAACKLLRRRCAEECPFSPYFSPHEPQKFAAVHKVFGASNVSKMLLEVPDSQRADAANSLVYEANLRIRDPVYGCMGAISALQHQIQTLQSELDAVRTEILRYKYREARINPNPINHPHTNNMGNTGPVTLVISSATTLSCTSTDTAIAAAVPPPPPPPSMVMSSTSSSSSSTSSIYTTAPTASTAAYSSISSDHNVSYFE